MSALSGSYVTGRESPLLRGTRTTSLRAAAMRTLVAMSGDRALGSFLRARREQVEPSQVGLRTLGPRRTPGLRREEVASLAGISVEYLVRLERGRDRRPSPGVVESLADVLMLDHDGRAHLAALADLRHDAVDESDAVAAELIELMETWSHPAIVMNRFLDLLAVNGAGGPLHLALGLEPGDNMARAFFLGGRARELYPDHDQIAEEVVGNLRALGGVDVRHPRLVELVGELSVANDQFATLWARAEVWRRTNGQKRIRIAGAGTIALSWVGLEVAASPGQMLVAYHAQAGSVSAERLAELTTTKDVRVSSGP